MPLHMLLQALPLHQRRKYPGDDGQLMALREVRHLLQADLHRPLIAWRQKVGEQRRL